MNVYVFPIVILPLVLFLFIASIAMTTFFHELGHAIPTLLFTKGQVKMFVGSYDRVPWSKLLKIGRLHIYFRLNILKWRGGMVQSENVTDSVFKDFIILIMGPLFSLIVASIAVWVVFSIDLNGFLKFFFVVFSFAALLDLRNIYPVDKPVLLPDGTYTYNDGYQIRWVSRLKKDYETSVVAYEFYSSQKYAEAIILFETLKPTLINNQTFDIALTSYCCDKNYTGGKEFYQKVIDLPNRPDANSNIFANIGIIESFLGNDELAMRFYNKSLDLNSENINSLLNRGYTYNLFGRYNEAIVDFDKAMKHDFNLAYSLANRGYSKIKLNLVEEGLFDINQSIALDDANSYAYRNLGLYYLEKEDYAEAFKNLQKAFDLDPDTHMLKEYLKLVEDKLANA